MAVGERVVVIGGGDVALDAARSAIRLQVAAGRDPDVTIAYRRTKVEMPANVTELDEARDEGLKVEFLVQPVAIDADDAGRLAGLKLVRCELGEPDGSGRRQPVPVEGSQFELAADTVIFAVGQAMVDDFLAGCEGVRIEDGQIRVDRQTCMTDRPGVFAGGDAAATGYFTAIEAVAAGRRAAAAIHNHLRGETLLSVWNDGQATARPSAEELAGIAIGQRVPLAVVDGLERRADWREVSAGYSAAEAVAEAERCLACAVCSDCGSCVRACPSGAVDLDEHEWSEQITVGSVIVATGHQEFDARRKLPLGFGRYDNVITQSMLARLLSASGPTEGDVFRPSDGAVPRKIFMLQCVGSRDCTSSGNEHCSAICCLFATLHASLLKQNYPDADITIGYTDMRTPGKAHEEYYRLVQSRGVRYVRGRVGEIIEEPDKSLRVRFEDTVTGRKNEELFDLVVLSAGLEASDGTGQIAGVAGLQTATAGFVKEYHPKLAPVDTQRAGIFLCGTAQGPKNIPDSIAQAKAAAARAVSLLSSGFVLTPAQVSSSDPELCIGCGVCETACPQGAVALSSGADVARRRRCEHLPRLRHLRRRLPVGRDAARRLHRRRDSRRGARVSAAPTVARERRVAAGGATAPAAARRSIVAFCCRECAYAAADASANARTPLPPSVRLVLVPCTGRVSPLHLVEALSGGADGAMVAGCLEGQCHYREGNLNALDRVLFAQRLLVRSASSPSACACSR